MAFCIPASASVSDLERRENRAKNYASELLKKFRADFVRAKKVKIATSGRPGLIPGYAFVDVTLADGRECELAVETAVRDAANFLPALRVPEFYPARGGARCGVAGEFRAHVFEKKYGRYGFVDFGGARRSAVSAAPAATTARTRLSSSPPGS